jgi:hypothetical protein
MPSSKIIIVIIITISLAKQKKKIKRGVTSETGHRKRLVHHASYYSIVVLFVKYDRYKSHAYT